MMCKLLTVSETAKRLGLSRESVYHRIWSGTLEHIVQQGKQKYLIPLNEIDRIKTAKAKLGRDLKRLYIKEKKSIREIAEICNKLHQVF